MFALERKNTILSSVHYTRFSREPERLSLVGRVVGKPIDGEMCWETSAPDLLLCCGGCYLKLFWNHVINILGSNPT